MSGVGEFLNRWAGDRRPYVAEDGGAALTYAEVNERARANRRLLWGRGIREENVGLLAADSVGYVVAYWSLIFASNTLLPLNRKLTAPELSDLLESCDCNWVVVDKESEPLARGLAAALGIGVLGLDAEYGLQTITPPAVRRARKNRPDVAILAPTSGSTDRPKVAMLSHEGLVANTLSHVKALGLSGDDRALVALPLSYAYANTAQLLSHTRLGGRIVLSNQPLFFARAFCEAVERHGVTVAALVPPLLRILSEYVHLDRHDLSSLRYACFGGAPAPADVVSRLMAALPATRFVHTYGLTEASPRVTSLAPGHDIRKIDSVGKPIPGVEVEVVNLKGGRVGPGEVGELRVRGKNLMAGYYNAPAESRRAVKGGWLYTGDLAKCDDEGYIYLTGRKKNVIICGGINVSPEEIERALLAHPRVRAALVRGEHSHSLGEIPVAHLSLDTGAELTLKDLHDFLRGRLAEFKWPKKLYVGPEPRRTATGKIERRPLREGGLRENL